MPRSYAAMSSLVTTKLQSTGTADWSVAEVDYQLEDSLKEFSTYQPHLVPVLFKIESRYGVATSTSAGNLVDASKDQFLSTDPQNEKVLYNVTDDTWAEIYGYTNAEQVVLTADIMAVNEAYEIYNKHCWNNHQIYIGDMPEPYEIDSVEYPIGTKRKWQLHDNVLEIDVEAVDDSDSTLDIPGSVDVLVRFSKPHVLSQLTDWAGTFAATAAAATTAVSATALQSAGTIEVGEEFYVQYHKAVYIVAASATIASSAATISFYPPLERAIASTAWTITFRQSSLRPEHEELFADLAAARLTVNKAPKFLNAVNVGGGGVWRNYLEWGERRLAETLGKLRRLSPPKTKRSYSRE